MYSAILIVLGIIAILTIACIAIAVSRAALFRRSGSQIVKSISAGPEDAEKTAAEVAEF